MNDKDEEVKMMKREEEHHQPRFALIEGKRLQYFSIVSKLRQDGLLAVHHQRTRSVSVVLVEEEGRRMEEKGIWKRKERGGEMERKNRRKRR